MAQLPKEREEPEAENASKAAEQAAAAAREARASARLRTASEFGTADRRVLEQTARHSRTIGFLKIALPILALGLIGTLIIYSALYRPDHGITIRYASKGTEENTIVMNGARFVGTDKKNEPFEVVARKARQNPDEPSLVELFGVKAHLTMQSGLGLTLVADSGRVDTANKILVLTGPITLTSSDGYKVTTSEARADLDAGTVTGRQPVLAQGPFGSLTASGFEADRTARTMKFTGRVDVHISPPAR